MSVSSRRGDDARVESRCEGGERGARNAASNASNLFFVKSCPFWSENQRKIYIRVKRCRAVSMTDTSCFWFLTQGQFDVAHGATRDFELNLMLTWRRSEGHFCVCMAFVITYHGIHGALRRVEMTRQVIFACLRERHPRKEVEVPRRHVPLCLELWWRKSDSHPVGVWGWLKK